MTLPPRRFIAGAALVVLAAGLAWHGVLFNDFAWDDEYLVVANDSITDLSAVPDLFTSPWAAGVKYQTGQAQNRPYYRPLALASMAVDWAIAGPDPVWFHLSNLAMHVLTSLLVLAWVHRRLRRVLPPPGDDPGADARAWTWAVALAMLYAVHPVHGEPVAVVTYRTCLLSGLFTFATLVVLGGARASPLRVLAGCGFLALGLLAKETTLVAPGLVALTDVYEGRLSWRRIAGVYVPLALVGVAWLFVRSGLIGAQFYTYFEGLTAVQAALMVPRIFFLYVRLALLPQPLCPFYDWWILGVPRSPLEPDILAGLLLFVLMVVAAIAFRRRAPALSLGLAFFLLALLPVSHVVPFFDAAGERFLYVPLVGLLLAAGGIAAAVPRTALMRRFGIGLTVVALVAFSTLSWVRAGEWHDSETMLRATLRDFPQSLTAHLGLGRLLLDTSRNDEAEVEFKEVTRLGPTLAVGHGLLAVSQARAGRIRDSRMTLILAPAPPARLPSAAEIARGEFIKADQYDILMKMGL